MYMPCNYLGVCGEPGTVRIRPGIWRCKTHAKLGRHAAAVATMVALVLAFVPLRVRADVGKPPDEATVLACRGRCAVEGLGCLPPCLPTTRTGSADCIARCHDAMDACYRRCGTFEGDEHPDPPPRT